MNLQDVIPDFQTKSDMKEWAKNIDLGKILDAISVPGVVYYQRDEETVDELEAEYSEETRILINQEAEEGAITTFDGSQVRVIPDSSYHHVSYRIGDMEESLQEQIERL